MWHKAKVSNSGQENDPKSPNIEVLSFPFLTYVLTMMSEYLPNLCLCTIDLDKTKIIL